MSESNKFCSLYLPAVVEEAPDDGLVELLAPPDEAEFVELAGAFVEVVVAGAVHCPLPLPSPLPLPLLSPKQKLPVDPSFM